MKRLLAGSALALSFVLALAAGCGRARDDKEAPAAADPLAELKAPPASAQLTEDVKAVVDGNTRFGLDLFGKVREQQGNLFLSPFSISTSLAMTAAGARGDTAAEMHKVLHFSVPADRLNPAFASLLYQTAGAGKPKGYELAVANALFGQAGLPFKQPFLTTLEESYGAPLQEVDFRATAAARETINRWAAQHTRGHIKEAVKERELSASSGLVLINAIYFRGKWAEPFKDARTLKEDFQRAQDDKVKVQMMHQQHPYYLCEADGAQVLQLPYTKGQMHMLIVLPKAADGLPALERALSLEKIQAWRNGLREHLVELSLPRFQLRSRFALRKPLEELGIRSAFDPAKADFRATADVPLSRNLSIERVVHEATVEVNEEGTVAAAITYEKEKEKEKEPPLAAVFRADHPFLILICDHNTGSLLFLGRVADPGDSRP